MLLLSPYLLTVLDAPPDGSLVDVRLGNTTKSRRDTCRSSNVI